MTEEHRTRLEKLEEVYKILIEKGNTFMASNVKREIENEKKNPTKDDDNS